MKKPKRRGANPLWNVVQSERQCSQLYVEFFVRNYGSVCVCIFEIHLQLSWLEMAGARAADKPQCHPPLPGGSHVGDSLLNRLLSVFDILNKHTRIFPPFHRKGFILTTGHWPLATYWAIIVVAWLCVVVAPMMRFCVEKCTSSW